MENPIKKNGVNEPQPREISDKDRTTKKKIAMMEQAIDASS